MSRHNADGDAEGLGVLQTHLPVTTLATGIARHPLAEREKL